MHKIILGTAQFGMDYGISGQGKIPQREVFKILDAAFESGIDTLDTAYVYGESEEIIGEFIRSAKKEFKVISKFPKCKPRKLRGIFNSSLKRLNISAFYGYLVHDFRDFLAEPELWDVLASLKSEGKIEKIGFSLYFPNSLDYIFKSRIKPDLVQVPYNIFDRRFESYFPKLKNNGTEINTRSVFLQGLVFVRPQDLDNYFIKIREKIADLNLLEKDSHIPIQALCLNFAVLNKFIDKVVVGVNSINDTREIIGTAKHSFNFEKILPRLRSFKEEDEKIILPLKWKLNKPRNTAGNIIAIIQARFGASRLPGKVLFDLLGKTVLQHVVERVASSRLVDKVIVATSINKADLKIVKLCSDLGIRVYRGSENDVLDRYYQAARLLKAEHILRITADCPLIDPKIIDTVINIHLRKTADYTSNIIKKTFPDGLDTEIFTFAALKKAWKNAKLTSEREHVTPYIRKRPKNFKIKNLACKENLSLKRWTLDYLEDYKFIKTIYKNLYRKNNLFGMREVLEFLKINPEVERVNNFITRDEGYLKSLREDKKIKL